MIKNSSFKTLLIGFSGGLIAIVLFFEFANPIQEPINRIHSDQLIDGNPNTPTVSANFSGLNTTDFKLASKNSINSGSRNHESCTNHLSKRYFSRIFLWTWCGRKRIQAIWRRSRFRCYCVFRGLRCNK